MTRSAVVAGCLILQLGCSWRPDAAERLAHCLKEAIEEQPREGAIIRASCDLEMPGSYLVVLHPEGALREEQVVSAGLPSTLLSELRELRLGTNPGIYVISTDPGVSGIGTGRTILSKWTTSQMHFVQIDNTMVLAKTMQPVSVDIGGPPDRRVIEAIH